MTKPAPQPSGPGRPPAASRDILQDAAFELFLENGYAGTTVDQVARRAGVSRNTFFNYFDAKGDVFWVELDEAIEHFTATLAEMPADASPLRSVGDALVSIGDEFGPSRVPFALTQHDLIGSAHDLQASALGRFTTLGRVIRDFLVRGGVGAAAAQAAAYALLGAAVAATQVWAAAGTGRGELGPYLRAAVGPVVAGFAGASLSH
ncbi:TetR family transcriptional regulator [Homoserinimonas aerilata]|uniref:TetR family transcriptional regulator n=1 Tax=Homoserinimonas aerilata TaxID=1162970 RepID=A0A542YI53_9MICO|nr:TetR/AcrR family transcriptional regulator [Homoserinimonas aerilata]TQL47762.1 TetR family transcriptional regulator [Homoserinimonas aerilata]